MCGVSFMWIQYLYPPSADRALSLLAWLQFLKGVDLE